MTGNNFSTIAFRSNLQPVVSSCIEDHVFLSKIRDPFALEKLKNTGGRYSLSWIQRLEYDRASLHCSYAAKGDYPWGTVTDVSRKEHVVCKCINTFCRCFSDCRPDFNPKELDVITENEKSQLSIFQFFENRWQDIGRTDGDSAAAAAVYDIVVPGNALATEDTPPVDADVGTLPDAFVLNPAPKVPEPSTKVQKKDVDFSSFVEGTQDQIITASPADRSVVNAGPGTGKTWTLIERIIHLINTKQTEAQNILVLCFSKSAVEVVRSRLTAAGETGRIDYGWQKVDIRTFDSFSTYMIAWVQANYPELFPPHYMLEAQDYDARIRKATDLLKAKKNMLESYEHIIVDEVQDLVGSRAELVHEMLKGLPDTCGFTILGDSCQSLYDYLAAGDPSVVSSEQFYKDIFRGFPSASYYSLSKNHRQGDTFGAVTLPYRSAILTGTAAERTQAANDLVSKIGETSVKLQHFNNTEAAQYLKKGTLGILTRTNGQALQISAWLRNEGVPHSLQRAAGTPALGDWISRILFNYPNDTINEASFIAKYLAVYPNSDYDMARKYWDALISTQYGEAKSRYEIEDLLRGLLSNARYPILFESAGEKDYAITLSNTHRAKGKEFDTVIVIDDVITEMVKKDVDDILEHKVCYVALTRPKKAIERVTLPTQYIYIAKNETRRCFKSSYGRKQYLSHFEVGFDSDIDNRTFSADESTQTSIRDKIKPDMRLRLIKCAEDIHSHVTYRLVPEDNERMTLGYTTASFAREMEKAIQRIFKNNYHIGYKYFPNAFGEIYVDRLTTCISGMSSNVVGSRAFGSMNIWTGISITGFAMIDKDTY